MHDCFELKFLHSFCRADIETLRPFTPMFFTHLPPFLSDVYSLIIHNTQDTESKNVTRYIITRVPSGKHYNNRAPSPMLRPLTVQQSAIDLYRNPLPKCCCRHAKPLYHTMRVIYRVYISRLFGSLLRLWLRSSVFRWQGGRTGFGVRRWELIRG